MSPKTPRNISGQQLIKLLLKYGYEVSRQKGSHIRLTNSAKATTHHITIPDHNPLKLGTLSGILNEVCQHLEIDREELLKSL
jgi:predicted RNA binding protein YcfA (HicA-like mRNA interferase family)